MFGVNKNDMYYATNDTLVQTKADTAEWEKINKMDLEPFKQQALGNIILCMHAKRYYEHVGCTNTMYSNICSKVQEAIQLYSKGE